MMPLEEEREDEHGESASEREGSEEAEPDVAVRRKPLSPTQREREMYEASHLPFRSWCDSCVAGRARARKHMARHCEPVNRLHFDYFFGGDDAKTYPVWCVMTSWQSPSTAHGTHRGGGQ